MRYSGTTHIFADTAAYPVFGTRINNSESFYEAIDVDTAKKIMGISEPPAQIASSFLPKNLPNDRFMFTFTGLTATDRAIRIYYRSTEGVLYQGVISASMTVESNI